MKISRYWDSLKIKSLKVSGVLEIMNMFSQDLLAGKPLGPLIPIDPRRPGGP